MKSNQPWNKESGASLVAIMVAMAIFAIVAVMASQSFRNINFSGRRVEAAMSAREVENVILQRMVAQFQTFVRNGCTADPNTFFNGLPIGGLIMANRVKANQPVRFYDASINYNPTNPPAAAGDDLKRCYGTPFSSAAPQNSDTFYSCFDLKTIDAQRNKASNDAFAANRGAFLETYVKLRNFKTDALTLCNAMILNRGFGLEVYYSLHWTTQAGDKVLYDSKLGTLNAAFSVSL